MLQSISRVVCVKQSEQGVNINLLMYHSIPSICLSLMDDCTQCLHVHDLLQLYSDNTDIACARCSWVGSINLQSVLCMCCLVSR